MEFTNARNEWGTIKFCCINNTISRVDMPTVLTSYPPGFLSKYLYSQACQYHISLSVNIAWYSYLVISLCIVKDASRNNLCNNLLAFIMLLLNFSSYLFCDCFLLRRVIEDGRSVLSASVGSLCIDSSRI